MGADIYMAHDGNHLYVHIQAEREGWVSVEVNTQGGGMDRANMIIGYLEEVPAFRDDVGRGRNHVEADVTAVEEFYLSHAAGTVVMEFSYPLTFPEGVGYNLEVLVPGETYTMIVSSNINSNVITQQHTNRGSVAFTVEP